MQAVRSYLEQNHNRFVRELCDYVRFPSVSAQPHHRPDVTACARWLQKHCQKIGLEARLCATPGNPVVLARTPRSRRSSRPHFLVYGHYDVQPPEPLELWHSPPFEPRIKNRSLFARGASDNKGQHLAHLNAVEAFLKTGTELPCDLTFLIEGEEEIGSAHLALFLQKHRQALGCDAIVISDNGIPDLEHPGLTYALRGIAALEIILHGPSRDLHSGIHGGAVENPAMALCQMIASLRDKNGRIAVPGLYDEVAPLSRSERQALDRLPGTELAYRKFLGVRQLFGERGYSALERRTSRPTLEINGLTSGYQGEGSKTIIPAWARAKLTLRLVPKQNPRTVFAQLSRHLKKICPPTVRMTLVPGHGGKPYWVSPDGRLAHAALRALKTAFGCDPVLLREGGSIPILADFKRVLGVDILLLGLGLPDDNAHSPNEKFSLDAMAKGMWMSANLWKELSAIISRK